MRLSDQTDKQLIDRIAFLRTRLDFYEGKRPGDFFRYMRSAEHHVKGILRERAIVNGNEWNIKSYTFLGTPPTHYSAFVDTLQKGHIAEMDCATWKDCLNEIDAMRSDVAEIKSELIARGLAFENNRLDTEESIKVTI